MKNIRAMLLMVVVFAAVAFAWLIPSVSGTDAVIDTVPPAKPHWMTWQRYFHFVHEWYD